MNFIGWGLFLSYNPFFMFYLMNNGAIGGTRIRMAIVLLLGFATFIHYLLLLSRKPLRFKFGFTSWCMLTLFLGTLMACFHALIKTNDPIYFAIDLLPLFEFFLAYFVGKLALESRGGLVITQKTIRLSCWFIAFMAMTDLFSYFYLTYIDVANFGALRAYINGKTVNRLPDFIIPCIAPFLVYRLVQHSTSLLEKILTCLTVAVTFLSFYRTLYATFAFTTCALFALNLFGIKRRHAIHLFGSALLIGIVLLIALFNDEGPHSHYVQLILERFASIFTTESVLENSKASRLGQMAYLRYIADYFPLGWGLGGVIDVDPIAVMFNYFMQFGLLLGLPFLGIFLLLWTLTLLRIIQGIRTANSPLKSTFFKALFSITLSLILILNIFPYMTYFPFLFLFGAMVSMLDCPIRFADQIPAKKPKQRLFVSIRIAPQGIEGQEV